MQKLIVISLIGIGTAIALAAEDFSTWINYSSPKGRYSVLFPKAPTLTTQEAPTPGGEKLEQFFATSADSSLTYMVGYFDYTPQMSYSLQNGRDGMVNAVKGTLLGEKSISLGGFPGLEIKVAATGADKVDYIIHVRFYDVNKRVYFLQFIVPKTDDTSVAAEKMTKYFDSFKVLPGS
jgi:hypothetical protein